MVASYSDVFEFVWAKCLREDETYQLLHARTYELLGIAAWKDGGAVKARSSLQPAGADR